MLLIYGTMCMALAALIFGITLIGSRNPREPAWAGDSLVANVYLPAIAGLALIGLMCLIKFSITIGSQSAGFKEIALTAGIIAVSLLLLKLLRIKQHLAEYESMERSASIIKPAVFFKDEGVGEKPEPPAKPTSGKKAA
jgi:hypothetical protein